VANESSNDISVLLNQGGGTFAPAVAYAAGVEPWSVAVGDLDGVNGLDLAVANDASHDVSVLLNRGDGTFTAALAYFCGDAPRSVAIGELDGADGPDLAVANGGGYPDWHDDLVVLLNEGDGTFAGAVSYGAGEHPGCVVISELDGANGPDLAVVNPAVNEVLVLLNLCASGDCPWDCQDEPDGEVGVVDFLTLLAQWGQVGTSCDYDGDGVSVSDFLLLLAGWGSCP
jgi:hypothetical protein